MTKDSVLFITNIPSPYRVDFFNELGKWTDLTVIFEARRVKGIQFNWNDDLAQNFHAIFLSDGEIKEKKINLRIVPYLKRDYKFVFFTNYAYLTETFALIWYKIHRKDYLLELDGGQKKAEGRVKYRLKKMLIGGACHYMSPGKATDELLLFYGVPKNKISRYSFSSLHRMDILRIPPSPEEKQALRTKYDIREPRVVLAVGQIIYRKGFDTLIRASGMLTENTGVYIVGGKPTEEYIELTKKYSAGNVTFLPFQKTEVVYEYMRLADVFVLPTRADFWGLVINEAMANALPVVTTDACVAGLELIRDGVNGYIVSPDSPEELGARICQIIETPQIAERMAVESLKIISSYSIETMAQEHARVLNEL